MTHAEHEIEKALLNRDLIFLFDEDHQDFRQNFENDDDNKSTDASLWGGPSNYHYESM